MLFHADFLPCFFQFKRKSVKGLALGMFLLMIVENLCFGLSIVLKSPREGQTEAGKALHHLPWLIATVGSFFSDSVVSFVQANAREGWELFGLYVVYRVHRSWEHLADLGLVQADLGCSEEILM